MIFELAIVRLLLHLGAHDIKCVYIAPNKALCQQKTRDWTSSFGALGVKSVLSLMSFNLCRVVEITGDTAIERCMRLVAVAALILTTVDTFSYFNFIRYSPKNGIR